MNIPEDENIQKYCDDSKTKIILNASLCIGINGEFPLTTPTHFMSLLTIDFFLKKTLSEDDSHDDYFDGGNPLQFCMSRHQVQMLLNENLMSKSSIIASIGHEVVSDIDGCQIHLRKMPRYDFIAGSWHHQKSEAPNYSTALYENVVILCDDPSKRITIRVRRNVGPPA